MRDFRIVQARALLETFSIAPIRGFSPPSVIITGKDLNTTTEILYNGIQAFEFVVSSSTRLIVRIPPSQVGKDLTDLQVFASKPALRGEASLVLELARPVTTVSGLDRLVQSWVMLFLTTPGTDVFTPMSGGGARAIIGSTTNREYKSVGTDLTVSIERTQTELLRLQSQSKGIPPDERLLSSSLESISTDEVTGIVSARVQLRNMVNQAAQVTL